MSRLTGIYWEKEINKCNFTTSMEKELYLYSGIYNFVAKDLIQALNENPAEDVTLRINTPGGDVFAGWGIIAKMVERTGKTNIKVDGTAMSMGAMLLPFADHVEALDVTVIMLHRASMFIENEEDQKFLDNVNKDLRKKLESKIDDEKLKSIKGVGLKDLFENEKRIDLFLSAREAKQIGLINKINSVDPKELAAFNSKFFSVAAEHKPEPINSTMTLEELKAKHPTVFAEVHNLGVTAGIAQEKERVEACLVFIEVDAAGVKEAIASGKALGPKQMAEFSLKVMAKGKTADAKDDSAAAVETKEDATKDKTDKEKTVEAFEANVRKGLGMSDKK